MAVLVLLLLANLIYGNQAECLNDNSCLAKRCGVGSGRCIDQSCQCLPEGPLHIGEPRAMCSSDLQCSSRMLCFVGEAQCVSGGCRCPGRKK